MIVRKSRFDESRQQYDANSSERSVLYGERYFYPLQILSNQIWILGV